MKHLFAFAVVSLLLGLGSLCVQGHPGRYAKLARKSCQDMQNPPKIHSYHIHVLFYGNNKNSTGNAMKLREKVRPDGDDGSGFRSPRPAWRILYRKALLTVTRHDH
jgi:hypothetical protein